MQRRPAALALLALTGATAAQAERPNVVLIVTDDQGYGDLGVHGNPVLRTPHLDAMARRSAVMTTFYVCPVCAPTRASLMTGRYHYRTRVVDTYIGRAMMESEETTLAEILREHGYATGIFGKWHLGDCYPMRPIDQGFEHALVHRGGGIGQPSDPPGGEGRYTDAVLFEDGERVETAGYCTDVYFDRALRFVERAREQGRSFFAYLAPNCPHGPFHDVPEAEHEAYRREDLRNERFPQDDGWPLPAKTDPDRRARIFAMIANIDHNVGRLFARLDELGLTRDTLVLFLVDNGPNERRYVAGMRGMKGEVYEGGIRSPFFAHWPGRLRAGQASDRVAAHIDVLPTVLEACGVAVPAGLRLDGRSLLPLLVGEATAWPDRTIHIQAHRGDVPVPFHHFAARSQRWKLVRATGFGRERPGEAPFELYDMARDPLEQRDVAAEHPEVVASMRRGYQAWFDDVASTRPDNWAPPRIHLGHERADPVVLTRQDWRRLSHDSGWQPNSRGRWEVRVVRPGRYDVLVRWRGEPAPERVALRIGGVEAAATVEAGARSCAFEALRLEAGDAAVEAVLTDGDTARGPHQIEVRRR